MAIEFPSMLGNCLTKTFNYSDQDIDRLFTPMESGNKRRRQRTKNVPTDFGVMFLFDQQQLSVFEYFNQEILLSRTLEFEIVLKTGQGNVIKTVKYSESPPSIRRLGIKYEVACSLETTSASLAQRTYGIEILKTLEHDTAYGIYNSLVQVDTTHYMLAYTGNAEDGFVKIFTINESYDIVQTSVLEHETGFAFHNSLVQIDATHYMLAYQGVDFDGFIKVFVIDPDDSYSITQVGATVEFDTVYGAHNSLARLDDNHFILVYQGGGISGPGKIAIFNVDGTYAVTQVGTSFTYESNQSGEYPQIIRISNNRCILAYARGQSGTPEYEGWIKIVNIDGSYGITIGDTFRHEAFTCLYNSLAKIDDSTYLLAYTGDDDEGWVKVFSLNESLEISQTASINHDKALGKYNSINVVDSTHFVLAYSGTDSDGFLRTFKLDGALLSVVDNIEHDVTLGEYNSLVPIGASFYILAYSGKDNDGYIKTLSIG